MSLVDDYRDLWGLRFALGVAEVHKITSAIRLMFSKFWTYLKTGFFSVYFIQAPYYTGVIFLLGSWYTKEELAKRIMCFVIGGEIAGSVGGFIAGAIGTSMEYAASVPSWKWLFIIEGLIGVVVGITGFFVLPSFPHNTKWLTPEERVLAVARVQSQGKQVISKAYNWKT